MTMTLDFAGCLETDLCVRCLDASVRYRTGHVTIGPHLVHAGWCDACFIALRMDRLKTVDELRSVPGRGWSGHWVPAMGLSIVAAPTARAAECARKAADIEETWRASDWSGAEAVRLWLTFFEGRGR